MTRGMSIILSSHHLITRPPHIKQVPHHGTSRRHSHITSEPFPSPSPSYSKQ